MVLSERWRVSDDAIENQIRSWEADARKNYSKQSSDMQKVSIRRLLAGAPVRAKPPPIYLASAVVAEDILAWKRGRKSISLSRSPTMSFSPTPNLPSELPSRAGSPRVFVPRLPQQGLPFAQPDDSDAESVQSMTFSTSMPTARRRRLVSARFHFATDDDEEAEDARRNDKRMATAPASSLQAALRSSGLQKPVLDGVGEDSLQEREEEHQEQEQDRNGRLSTTNTSATPSSRVEPIKLHLWLPLSQSELLVSVSPDMPVHTAATSSGRGSRTDDDARSATAQGSLLPSADAFSRSSDGGRGSSSSEHKVKSGSRSSGRTSTASGCRVAKSGGPKPPPHERNHAHSARPAARRFIPVGPPAGPRAVSSKWNSLQALIEDFTGLPIQEQHLRVGSLRIDKASGVTFPGASLSQCEVSDGATIIVTVSSAVESADFVKGVQQRVRKKAQCNRAGTPVWVMPRWEHYGTALPLPRHSCTLSEPSEAEMSDLMPDAPHPSPGRGFESILRRSLGTA